MSDQIWQHDLQAAIAASKGLQSIFTKIDIGQGQKGIDRSPLQACRLEANEAIVDNHKQDDLADQFQAEIVRLAKLGLDRDENTIFYLKQAYGWRLAPTHNAVEGVSWFDEDRIKQATATAGVDGAYILLQRKRIETTVVT